MNQKQLKQRNRPAKRVGGKKKKDPLLTLRLEFSGQQSWKGWLSSAPFLVVTNGSGDFSSSTSLDVSQIPNFSTRFGAAFQEARVVGARVKILPNSSTNPGILNFWFESGDDTTAPTLANSEHQTVKRLNASNVSGGFLSYVPHDPKEVEWALITGTATVAGNFNIFTNTANYGTGPGLTLALVQLDLHVQLRGLV